MASSLTFAALYSGSSGNCVYIRAGSDEILIDEGRNTKQTEEALSALGSSLRRIEAIFVTHEHTDHIAGLAVTAKKYGIPLYMTERSLAVTPSLQPYATPMPIRFSVTVGGITVESFPTPHDAAMSVGYTVKTSGARLGVATDMGFLCKEVAHTLAGCDAALIESNYDPEMLRLGPYPPALKERIASDRGHLPNESAALLAAVLAKEGASRIALGHLSEQNNTPRLAYAAAEAELARRDVRAALTVADRDRPTVIL